MMLSLYLAACSDSAKESSDDELSNSELEKLQIESRQALSGVNHEVTQTNTVEETFDPLNIANLNTTIPESNSLTVDNSAVNNTKEIQSEKKSNNSIYKEIKWVDLIPEDDLKALLNPPSYITNIPEGGLNDQITADSFGGADSRYRKALESTQVKPEFNNRKVKIPGFIVPLDIGTEQMVTSFFLVPFFGACLHLPPPPPNQTIYAEYKPGFKLKALYAPFWIEGILTTSVFDNDTATAAYVIKVATITEYSE